MQHYFLYNVKICKNIDKSQFQDENIVVIRLYKIHHKMKYYQRHDIFCHKMSYFSTLSFYLLSSSEEKW